MSDQIRQIAARLKDLREIAGASVEDLAKELGISAETYLEFESGTVDIPVSYLYKAAGRFGVELTAILTGEDPRLHTYCLVRKNKGVSVDRRKEYKYQSLAFNFAGKKSEPFLVTVDPEPEETPVHYSSHSGQEFNYLLEGSMKVYINGYEIVLNEGDSLYFNSGLSHGMKAVGTKPARFLAIIM